MVQYPRNILDEMIDDGIWTLLGLESMGYGVESDSRTDSFDDGSDPADFLAGPHRSTKLSIAGQHEDLARSLGMTNHNVWLLVRDCRLYVLDRCGRSGQQCILLPFKACGACLHSQFAT